MIKVEVVEDFKLKAFDELKNIVRSNPNKNEKGKLYSGDTCECTQEMCEYLTGNNPINKVVVKIIEIVPEKKETPKEYILEDSKIEYIEEPIKPKATFKKNKKKK